MDSKKKLALLSLAAILPLIGAGCAADTTVTVNDTTPTSTATDTAPTNSNTTPPVAAPVTAYKDGTYSVVGAYVSPGGNQKLNVTLVIKNDVVVDATVTDGSVDPASKQYQAIFISGYKVQVIGKKLSEINVTKVSGSSLTPLGFMDAVAKIKVEAKG